MAAKKRARTPQRAIEASLPGWAIRLQERLRELGWPVAELARRMDPRADQAFIDRLYKYHNGKVKNPRGEMLEWIAKVVGLTGAQLRYGGSVSAGRLMDNIHRLHEPASIRTLGEVAANVWRDAGSADEGGFDQDEQLFPPDPRYPVDAQYDLIVRGTSINRFAHDGYRLRVVDLLKTGLEAPDGELVIVRRTKESGQIVETTAKRIRYRRDGRELWPDSDDPKWQQPLTLGGDPEDETVQIIGLVLYAYKTTGRRR